MLGPSRRLAQLGASVAALKGYGAVGQQEPLPAVPWQPGPERFSVQVPGSDASTISLYPGVGQVGVSTGDSLRQALRDPEDGGMNWYFLELYDHMCPHCWYAVPIVSDVASAFQDAAGWKMTSLNCHMRQNGEVCYFLEIISGAMDYPTFLLCPVPYEGDFQIDDLPERARRLLKQLEGEQRDTFVELMRCRVRYQKDEEQEDKGPFLSADSLAGWLQEQTSIEAPHPEMLQKGADFVDPRDVGPRSPPGQPGWLKDDKPAEPGVPAYDPGQRWFDALRGFINTLYQEYRASRHQAAVNAARFLSRSFPIKGKELGSFADRLEAKGPFENLRDFKLFITEWAVDADMDTDPSDQEDADDYASCGDSNCAMWALLHVTLTAVASRGLSGRPLFSDDGLVGKDLQSFVTIDEAVNFVREYVEAFLSCAPCKQQFLDDFDRCQYGNCQIQDHRELPLWLWRVHNSVSLRVALQHKSGIDRRWPMYLDCPKCWKDELVLSGDPARRLRSSTASLAMSLASPGNASRPSRRLDDYRPGAGDDFQFSAEDLDAPFETSRVFWHMVRTYISIQRVAFELNDLSDEEQEEVDRVVEVERAMASGKLTQALQGGFSSKGGSGASPVLLMLLSISGCIVCVFCGMACAMGQMKERASRAPTFRAPENDVAADREDLDPDPDGPAAE